MPATAKRARKRRPARSTLLMRWVGLGALVLVAVLYSGPLRTYVGTKHTLGARRSEVRMLRAQKDALERRLTASASDATLVLEARRLGLVKRGERLFIVKGIDAWRRAHSTIRRHG
jgi:hypothetical protein